MNRSTAAYLAATGLDPSDARGSASPRSRRTGATSPRQLVGPIPGGKPVWYQKHMTHHMVDAFGLDWMSNVRNAFLIRDPAAVLASYTQKREECSLADIGILRQRELFEREADRLGKAPPVIEGQRRAARSVASAQRASVRRSGIAYTDVMLSWPAGRRKTDGVWAPALVRDGRGVDRCFGRAGRDGRRSALARRVFRSWRTRPGPTSKRCAHTS